MSSASPEVRTQCGPGVKEATAASGQNEGRGTAAPAHRGEQRTRWGREWEAPGESDSSGNRGWAAREWEGEGNTGRTGGLPEPGSF